jgi:hypothetical protein
MYFAFHIDIYEFKVVLFDDGVRFWKDEIE